ncbi:MAG: hypothetical protein ACJAQ3_003799 [Planctomycetota bacterium]
MASPCFEKTGAETESAYAALSGDRYRRSVTSSDGSYRIEGVPSFRYFIRVEEVPYAERPSKLRIGADLEQSFRLPPGVSFGGIVITEAEEDVEVTLEFTWHARPADFGFNGLGSRRRITVRSGVPFLLEGLEPGLYQVVAKGSSMTGTKALSTMTTVSPGPMT